MEEALGLAPALALAPAEAEGEAPAAGEGEALAAAEGEALADGVGEGLGDRLGVGEGSETSDDPAVETFWRLRLSPIGTTTIPSAVTTRKLTAPHSRRKKSRFK